MWGARIQSSERSGVDSSKSIGPRQDRGSQLQKR